METNSITWLKKYFRCICLNGVGTALAVGRIFPTLLKKGKHSTDDVNTALTKKKTLYWRRWTDYWRGKHSNDEGKHSPVEGKHITDEGKHSTEKGKHSADEDKQSNGKE